MTKKERKVLVTHDGTFHADDVFAYAVLSTVFLINLLIRSREKEDWAKGDIVFDVGGGEFDHHGIEKVYRSNGIPHASFGLIWEKFGKEYLKKRFGNELKDEKDIEEIFTKIDESFIQAIDAEDNGVNLVSNSQIPVNTISNVIWSFNHLVTAHVGATPEEIKRYQDKYFHEASKLAMQLLENEIIGLINELRARESVIKAFEERQHPALVVLDESCPWEDTIWELDKKQEVLYVIFPKPDGYYMQVVRKNKTTFDARKDLPQAWGGLRDEQLSEVIGIADAIFCHSALFLAGAISKESIMKMAEIAIN